MKLFRNYLCMAALILGACMVTACDDDDDDDDASSSTSSSTAASVEGSYDGYTIATFGYITTPYAYPVETLTITSTSDTEVDIDYTNDTWGTYDADGVTVTANSDGSYTLDGSGTATISYHGSTASTYECTVTGTVESDGTITVDFNMTFMGGTDIVFHSGDCPASYIVEYLASGSYSGTGYANSSYFTNMSDDGTPVLTVNVDGETIDVEYNSSLWGDFVMEGLTVTVESDGSYSLSYSDGTIEIPDYEGTEYAYTFTAEISGDLSTYTFTFTVEIMSTTTITYTEATDDDEEEEEDDSSETTGEAADGSSLAGTYTGTATVNFNGYVSETYTDQVVTITANDDGTVVVSYDGYADDSYDWGDYTTSSLTAYLSDTTYSLTSDGTDESSITYSAMGTYNTTFTLTATIVDNSDFEFEFYSVLTDYSSMYCDIVIAPAE